MVALSASRIYRDVQPNVAEGRKNMEYGTIEREIHVDALPEVVFDVISSPEHIREWWNAEAVIQPAPGATGELVWGDKATAHAHVVPITVVEAEPPRLFSFRWAYPDAGVATPANSLLVSFELIPSGVGTTVRLTEGGFRELGWEAAVLEELYNDHVVGWDTHLAHLGEYLNDLVSTQ
jgi:uncharacterized protein YndB with AHSA1/START domain